MREGFENDTIVGQSWPFNFPCRFRVSHATARTFVGCIHRLNRFAPSGHRLFKIFDRFGMPSTYRVMGGRFVYFDG